MTGRLLVILMTGRLLVILMKTKLVQADEQNLFKLNYVNRNKAEETERMKIKQN